MAKVPSGQTAATWDGTGAVWFKVFQDLPSVSGGQYTWPSNGVYKFFFFWECFRVLGGCVDDNPGIGQGATMGEKDECESEGIMDMVLI